MWIEIFRSGDQTDSAGRTKSWTDEDLDTVATKYNNQADDERHEAPVVIGHPVTDSPAYGWVEELKREGNVLLAKLKDLTPQFIEWVKAGLYKKRSISLYEDLTLKHIGFLGAVPPAVKGLADPVFNSDLNSCEYEYEEKAPDKQDVIDDPLDKKEQEDRSRSYGIEIKNIGSSKKPESYSALNDEEFADPVHYRFPISKSYILGSLASWSRLSVQKQYSEKEGQIIAARIVRAAKSYNINLTPFKWAYSSKYLEVSPDVLSRKQLLDIVNKINISKTNYKELPMNEKFAQFIADLITYLTDTFGEDAGNQSAAKIEELKQKYQLTEAPAPANGDDPPPSNSNENKRIQELELQLARISTDSRLKDFKAYAEKSPKLVPAQEDIVISALEMGFKSGATQFAENGTLVEKQGVDIIKALINSFPDHISMEGQAVGGTGSQYSDSEFTAITVNEESMKLHVKVKEYQQKAAELGKVISYATALETIRKGNK